MGSTFNYNTLAYDQTLSVIDKKIDSKNAVAYIRVSSDQQKKDGHGLEGQKNACIEIANNEELNLLRTFADEGISGKVVERKGLIDSLSYIAKYNNTKGNTPIRYFLCTEISRISRPEFIDEGLSLCKLIWEQDVIIYDVFSKDFYERGDDIKIIQLVMKLYAAKQERENGAKRSINGKNQRMKQGYRALNTPPAGYKYEHLTVGGRRNAISVLNEPHASTMRSALVKFSNGELISPVDFLTFLADRNFETNSLKKGCKRKIHSSLFLRLIEPHKLFFYAGKIIFPKWGITEPIEAKHEALIDELTLKRIFIRLGHRYGEVKEIKKNSSPNQDFPLKRVLKCRGCGKYLTGTRSHKGYFYYECKNNKLCPLKLEGSSRSSNRDKVHKDLEVQLENLQVSGDLLRLGAALLEEAIEGKQDSIGSLVKAKELELKVLEDERIEIENTLQKLTEKELVQSFQVNWKKIKNKIQQIRSDIEEIREDVSSFELGFELDTILKSPLSMRKIADSETKNLLVRVIFNGEISYSKKEGFRTGGSPFPLRFNSIGNTHGSEWWDIGGSNPGPAD